MRRPLGLMGRIGRLQTKSRGWRREVAEIAQRLARLAPVANVVLPVRQNAAMVTALRRCTAARATYRYMAFLKQGRELAVG